MTSSNGNTFRVTGPLCGEIPAQRPVARSFDVFFDPRLNKRLSTQSRSSDLRRHRTHFDVTVMTFGRSANKRRTKNDIDTFVNVRL